MYKMGKKIIKFGDIVVKKIQISPTQKLCFDI